MSHTSATVEPSQLSPAVTSDALTLASRHGARRETASKIVGLRRALGIRLRLPPWYGFAINGLLLRYIAGGGVRYTN
jgi:hypothetical protein